MIRFIVAIDSNNGIADEHGMPWQGKIPSDVAYYRGKIKNHTYIIGYGTYAELKNPISDTNVLVATHKTAKLRPGYKQVTDPLEYTKNAKEDVWVGGGAIVFSQLFDLADELYITQLEGDFHCSKFFPDFRTEFELMSSSKTHTENGINFSFQTWKRKSL